MSEIVFNENSTGTKNISNKNNNNNRIEDASKSICVKSDRNSRSNEIKIDSDIENSTPLINISIHSTVDDNTLISSLESENRDFDINSAISNSDEHNDPSIKYDINTKPICTRNDYC